VEYAELHRKFVTPLILKTYQLEELYKELEEEMEKYDN
jgi:hypothetical protein